MKKKGIDWHQVVEDNPIHLSYDSDESWVCVTYTWGEPTLPEKGEKMSKNKKRISQDEVPPLKDKLHSLVLRVEGLEKSEKKRDAFWESFWDGVRIAIVAVATMVFAVVIAYKLGQDRSKENSKVESKVETKAKTK